MAKPRLKKLEAQHHQAVRLRAEGRSAVTIAKEVGVRETSVRRWLCDPLFQAEVERMQERVGEIFAEKLAAAGLQTLDVMKQMLEMPISGQRHPVTGEETEREYLSFNERLQIIDRFLDRTPHTVKGGGESSDGVQEGVVIPPAIQAQLNMFSDMNPAELVEALRGIVDRPSRTPKAIEATAK